MAIGSTLDTSAMTLTFDDEFNTFSASPDGSTGLWRTTYANGARTLNGEQEYYSDSSVGVDPFSIQNGVLDITATPAAPGSNSLNLPYDSGVITTQSSFSQLYGYFEIDAKMPAGQGLWPAFWMLPASGAAQTELDVFEVLGKAPTTLYSFVHSSVQATQGTALSVANVSSGFNKYGVMWGPQSIEFYINDVEVASMSTPADMNTPMYMLANLAIGGGWGGNADSSTVFPASMQIDYVHAYAYPGTTGGTVYDTLPSQNAGPAALAPVISAPAGFQAMTGVATPISGLSIAANWPGGIFTATFSDSTGLLKTAATADVSASGEGTTLLTLRGNLSAINASLATLSYQGTAIGADWIWVAATDPQGQQKITTVIANDVANTTPLPPGPPVVTAPAAMALAANTTQALSGITVSDGQASGMFTVAVSDSTGILHTTAVSGVAEAGEGSTSLSLTGSLIAVNAELATLTYQAGSAAGSDWLWVSANDALGNQGLAHVVVTETPPVAPPAAAAPVVSAPATTTLAADTTLALTGISVADSQTTGAFTVTISDGSGLLNTTPVSGVVTQGQGSTSLTLTGGLAAIDADLANLTYQAGSATGADWLWVSANDANGNQGIGHDVVTVLPAAVAVNGLITGPQTTVLTGSSLVGPALQIDGGGTVENTGTLTWNGGTIALGSGDPTATNQTGTLDNAAGALFAIQGSSTVTGSGTSAFANSGTVDVSAGTLTLQPTVTDTGTFLLHGSGTLDFASMVGGGGTISFLSPTATLEVQAPGAFGSTILGFAQGDTIDVAPVPAGLATMLNFVQAGSGGTLTVSDGTQSSAFNLTGNYNTAGFHMASDSHGGTAVTFS